jgi:hypothetical protein
MSGNARSVDVVLGVGFQDFGPGGPEVGSESPGSRNEKSRRGMKPAAGESDFQFALNL